MLSSYLKPIIRLSPGFPGKNWEKQLGKIGSWVVKISSFKFTVQHIRGTQNVIADALSCMFSQPSDADPEQTCHLLLDFPLAFTDVLPHQLEDVELGPIIKYLREGKEHTVRT